MKAKTFVVNYMQMYICLYSIYLGICIGMFILINYLYAFVVGTAQ